MQLLYIYFFYNSISVQPRRKKIVYVVIIDFTRCCTCHQQQVFWEAKEATNFI